jgi:hypothetical protein
MAMQPHYHNNHGFSFCVNGVCTDGLVEVQQPQHLQQQQHQPPQHQQRCQDHVVYISNLQGHTSSNLSSSTFVAQFEKQRQEANHLINMQVKIHMYLKSLD